MEKLKEILNKYNITLFGVCELPSKENLIPCRAINRIPQNAKKVIMCAFPYYVGEIPSRNISRYAIVNDYHIVVKDILTDVCSELSKNYYAFTFEPFVDNSPIPEVSCAIKAGLGILGKNGLLITQKYGSYVFLGEIVTDFDFPPTNALDVTSCSGCDLCLKSCPSAALYEKPFNKNLCLSHITQKKGELSKQETDLIKKSQIIWGCDICQEVCPHNKNIEKTTIKQFLEGIIANCEYDKIDELVKTRAFGFKGAQVIKRNYCIIKDKLDKISP